MNTKTDGISSGLVAVAWMAADEGGDLEFNTINKFSCGRTEGTPLVRLSDAEAIISDLQNLVIAENQRKQQLEEEVMWLKAAQPNIALIANKDATIAKQAAFIEEQKGTITALNIALGGDDSTSTENLIDASEVDYSDEGLILLCRKLTIENVRLNDVVEFQKKAWTADHEDLTSQISELEASPMSEEALDILRSKIAKQSAALKLAREALFDMQDSYAAVHGWKDSFVIAATTAIAAIDSLQKGE